MGTSNQNMVLNIHEKFKTGLIEANNILVVLQNYKNRKDILHKIAKIIGKGLLEAKKIKNFIEE